MIVRKEDNFRIYVEDDNKNSISSGNILKDELIYLTIHVELGPNEYTDFTLNLTGKELKSLTSMLNEVVEFL